MGFFQDHPAGKFLRVGRRADLSATVARVRNDACEVSRGRDGAAAGARTARAFGLFLLAALSSVACNGDILEPEGPLAALTASATCGATDSACNGVCVSTASDPAHCGSCDHACAPGEFCSGGACSATCAFQTCQTATGPECADTSTNTHHCGACNAPCLSGQSCVGGQCTCGGSQTHCTSGCADLTADPGNCGTCGHACAGLETCVGGVCQPETGGCTGTLVSCNGTCVDTQTDQSHCGACDQPCGGGRACAAGSCACPGTGTFCDGACVDTQTDQNHCGACGNVCPAGTTCTNGGCACPAGQTACSGGCVDLQTDPSGCGSCGNVCAAGETCSAGQCRAALGADGCGGSARGITLSQVAVYQSVKIPVMDGGQPVDPAVRVAPVVQGRETLFRVFVTLDATYVSRELSARVTLTNGGATDQYYGKQTLAASSTDGSTGTTFQIHVPKEKIAQGTQFDVEVVECSGAPPGTLLSPRYPASGEADLGAIPTGPLKIRIVPVLANNRLPDTSDAALAAYRDEMRAMYPVTDVVFDLATQISTSYPIDWTALLDQIRAKRQADAPPADVYYYGFVKPTDTVRDFCQFSCTAGVGYVAGGSQASSRAAVGLAFADDVSVTVMAHEVGHNHGRSHAPCAPGSISGIDSSYPYAGASIGVWGYDSRSVSLLDPAVTTDIMGYCTERWVSDYTYRGFVNRVRSVNGVFSQLVSAEALQAFHVLLLDGIGPRWGVPFASPGEAFGAPDTAEVLDAAGTVIDRITVYRTDVADVDASTWLVPPPRSGWYAVRVPGADALPFAPQGGRP